MIAHDEPMTTFSEAEWRAYKRSIRHIRYVLRRRQTREADPAAWLAAVDRDDWTDPYEEPVYALEEGI